MTNAKVQAFQAEKSHARSSRLHEEHLKDVISRFDMIEAGTGLGISLPSDWVRIMKVASADKLRSITTLRFNCLGRASIRQAL